jgi:peptidoglycan/xylan/chitin deacetylase (PgdA/CDA1 family)
MSLRDRGFELFHVVKYMKPGGGKLGSGFATISIDFEMIKPELIQRELRGLEALLELSREYDIPMTFGVVANIIERDPGYIDMILDANPRNEIASHTYSHSFFNEITREQAEQELSISIDLLNSAGVKPVSMIFPRNQVNYLDLLPKYGFRSFRSFHNQKHRLSEPSYVNNLWDMPQSMFISKDRVPMPLVSMAKTAQRKGLHFHMWCHPYNWGENPGRELQRVLGPIARYSQDSGLGFRTMKEMAEVCESRLRTSPGPHQNQPW